MGACKLYRYVVFSRLLVVPVALRDESGSSSKLVGHPRLVYLHNTMSGSQLYECVLNLFPTLAQCTIVLTDGQASNSAWNM